VEKMNLICLLLGPDWKYPITYKGRQTRACERCPRKEIQQKLPGESRYEWVKYCKPKMAEWNIT